MAEVLKQALASLCSRSGWCYAVFWKLKRRSRMVLTWEDGYYEFAPSSNSLLAGSGRNLLEHGVFKQDGTLEDQIQLAVAKMSFHVYSLGEGIIGRVAFTGKHQWIFANGERISESGPAVSEKYPDGWSNQFAAGIKTIAVVAVQQGVVQLGSTQMMTEDLNLVGQIRALFGTLQSVPGAFVSDFVPEVQLGRGLPKTPISGARAAAPLTSSGRASLSNNNRSLRALEPVKPAGAAFATAVPQSTSSWGSPNLVAFTSAEPRTTTTTAAGAYDLQSLLFPGETVPGSFTSYGAHSSGFTQADNYAKRGRLSYEAMQSPAGSTRLPTPVDAGRVTGSTGDISSSFGFKLPTSLENNTTKQFDTTNLWSPLGSSGFSVADMEPLILEVDAGLMPQQQPADEGGFDYSSLFKAFQKDDLDDFNNLLASLTKECAGPGLSTSHFAVGDELSEALVLPKPGGPGIYEASNNHSNSNMLVDLDDVKPPQKHKSFQLPAETVTGTSVKTLGDIFGTLSDTKPEQLLDAIVAGASSSSSLSGNQFKPSSTSAASLETPRAVAVTPAPAPAGNPSPAPVPVSQKQQPLVPSPSFDRDIWAAASSVSLEVSSSSWTDRKSEDRSSLKDSGPTRKADEPARSNGRKRLRPGEAPRPRPKDRQQIQDRVRELRDIVPNATKCSIDALLEKTIRHMKFLQSVTQHGDKWKTGGGTDMSKSMDSGLESGASWALEYDGKGSGVPILVENLKQPRQMLVEMLCEERGLFWEIAENIRGLGLTILKGVMESRNDKVWARFNVEGTKEVNRVKVLWNLTQLLKVNPKNCAGAAAAASSFAGSEVTEICSESHGAPRFQPPVASHAIAVSPGWT